MSEETYLGDGLYVSYDGYQYRLRAPRPDGNDVVFLDPEALYKFWKYVDVREQVKISTRVPKDEYVETTAERNRTTEKPR